MTKKMSVSLEKSKSIKDKELWNGSSKHRSDLSNKNNKLRR